MMRTDEDMVEILADPETLAHRVAEWVLVATKSSRGPFAIALSGGATPRRLYELLAEPPYRDAMPWERIHWFWGDERFVPPDDPRSNYRMVYEALLSRVPVPPAHIHPIPTTGTTPAGAASGYERTLKSFYGASVFDPLRPLFELTLLGLGEDGHTASLFPGSALLDERLHWVRAVSDHPSEARITLTYPALESSRRVAFLVTGGGKRGALERLHRGDRDLPAARLRPVGRIHWFLDAAAAPEPTP